MLIRLFPLLLFFLIGNPVIGADQNALSVDESPTRAKTSDDFFISWVEHIIDHPITSSEPFNGSELLVMEDLD